MDEVAFVSWEDCAAVLKQCYADLGKRLTLGEILPELYSLRTITDYEKQEIEGASRTEYEQNRKLVDFLLKKGKREFRQFLQALDKVGRADLRDLLIASVKTELNVQRCIVVRSLNDDAELPSEELVSLWLEHEIGLKVDKSWLLDGHRCIMVRCGHDRDRQKALDKGRDVIDNHLVAFEVPDFLNKTDQLCSGKPLQSQCSGCVLLTSLSCYASIGKVVELHTTESRSIFVSERFRCPGSWLPAPLAVHSSKPGK